MKLSQKQLRNLIESTLRENEGFNRNPEITEAVTEAFETALGDFYFNADDPSMAAHGPEVWEMQKLKAVEKFGTEVERIVNGCIDALTNGEFLR